MTIIPTTYIDKTGSVETTITNDGEVLTLVVDNIEFKSKFYDDFAFATTGNKPERFSLNIYNELTDCRLLCQVPLTLLRNGEDFKTILTVDLELNAPAADDYKTNAIFSLTIENKQITTNKVQLFEGGLAALQELLPKNCKLKCCYGCSFSDYGVYGQGFFGTMLCFRNIKDKYLSVCDKDSYMDIMNDNDRFVQETYLCGDFQVRTKGTGYRG